VLCNPDRHTPGTITLWNLMVILVSSTTSGMTLLYICSFAAQEST
jgi:hypothetical protein